MATVIINEVKGIELTDLGEAIMAYMLSKCYINDCNYSAETVKDIAKGIGRSTEAVRGALSKLYEDNLLANNIDTINCEEVTFIHITKRGWMLHTAYERYKEDIEEESIFE